MAPFLSVQNPLQTHSYRTHRARALQLEDSKTQQLRHQNPRAASNAALVPNLRAQFTNFSADGTGTPRTVRRRDECLPILPHDYSFPSLKITNRRGAAAVIAGRSPPIFACSARLPATTTVACPRFRCSYHRPAPTWLPPDTAPRSASDLRYSSTSGGSTRRPATSGDTAAFTSQRDFIVRTLSPRFAASGRATLLEALQRDASTLASLAAGATAGGTASGISRENNSASSSSSCSRNSALNPRLVVPSSPDYAGWALLDGSTFCMDLLFDVAGSETPQNEYERHLESLECASEPVDRNQQPVFFCQLPSSRLARPSATSLHARAACAGCERGCSTYPVTRRDTEPCEVTEESAHGRDPNTGGLLAEEFDEKSIWISAVGRAYDGSVEKFAVEKGIVDVEAVFLSEFEARTPFVEFSLSDDAVKVATSPNAGGASVISESLSVEYFVRHFGASDIISETEVQYIDSNWKKVDYICTLFGRRFGVSVTRAMMYPDPAFFDSHRARILLRKKLHGLVVAWSGVSAIHSFSRAILHIWCETPHIANLLHQAFPVVCRELGLQEDILMVLTVAEGDHGWPIFYESMYSRTLISRSINCF